MTLLKHSALVGAIAGDIIGSVYEWERIKTKTFPLFCARSQFTDDTILTIAVADAFTKDRDFAAALRRWGRKYPGASYGGSFSGWLRSPHGQPYNSYGNGSAMRVSPAGCAGRSLEETLELAKMTAEDTHNHPEGIKGAQATAAAIFLARTGGGQEDIKRFVQEKFGYDLKRSVDQIRPGYSFNEICQTTVPEAITAFLEGTGFEDSIRNAVSLGGDSDTVACITGSIAGAFWGVPEEIEREVRLRLPEEMLEVLERFQELFPAD